MVKIEVSLGELCDRISILRIKEDRLSVSIPELETYNQTMSDAIISKPDFNEELFSILEGRLTVVNNLLWEVEEKIRLAHKEFDIESILTLSRLISDLNSTRSNIKKKINDLAGDHSEPKTY